MFPRCPDFECFSSRKRVLVGSIAVLLLMWWSEGLQVSLRMPEKSGSSPSAASMMGQRLRRCPIIGPALGLRESRDRP